MTQNTLEFSMESITSTPRPHAPTTSWISRIEQAFVQWQAKRLQEIPAGKLWAQAMQDTRSFAEIRRSNG